MTRRDPDNGNGDRKAGMPGTTPSAVRRTPRGLLPAMGGLALLWTLSPVALALIAAVLWALGVFSR